MLKNIPNENLKRNQDDRRRVPEREGYKVVYPDGYVSWPPKEVFEKAYQPISSKRSSELIAVNTISGEWEFLKEDESFDFCKSDSEQ